MISINLLLLMLLCHWVFDFLCQTDYMGNNKSKKMDALLSHTMWYSILWFIPMFFILGYFYASVFVIITFTAHTCTDFLTSRLTSEFYKNKLYRLFFNVIGADQLLHYVQLFLTYQLLA